MMLRSLPPNATLLLAERHSYGTFGLGVPKLLHQTWSTTELLPAQVPLAASWGRGCLGDDPGWARVLWSDEAVAVFMEEYAPASFLPTYRSYASTIQRVDTFRYVLLSVVGGVYADLDNECLAPPAFPRPDECSVWLVANCCGESAQRQQQHYLDAAAALRRDLRAASARWPPPPMVQNALMASRAGHPFWTVLLQLAVERGPLQSRVQRWFGVQGVLHGVGAELLSVANFVHADNASVCVLPSSSWHGNNRAAAEASSDAPPEATPPTGDEAEVGATLTTTRYVRHVGTRAWARRHALEMGRALAFDCLAAAAAAAAAAAIGCAACRRQRRAAVRRLCPGWWVKRHCSFFALRPASPGARGCSSESEEGTFSRVWRQRSRAASSSPSSCCGCGGMHGDGPPMLRVVPDPRVALAEDDGQMIYARNL